MRVSASVSELFFQWSSHFEMKSDAHNVWLKIEIKSETTSDSQSDLYAWLKQWLTAICLNQFFFSMSFGSQCGWQWHRRFLNVCNCSNYLKYTICKNVHCQLDAMIFQFSIVHKILTKIRFNYLKIDFNRLIRTIISIKFMFVRI